MVQLVVASQKIPLHSCLYDRLLFCTAIKSILRFLLGASKIKTKFDLVMHLVLMGTNNHMEFSKEAFLEYEMEGFLSMKIYWNKSK